MAEMRVAQADARATFSQIDDAMAQALQGLQAMQDTATQMTSSSWLGTASTKFASNWQQVTDDLRTQHQQLLQLVEHGRNSVNTLVNHDAEL